MLAGAGVEKKDMSYASRALGAFYGQLENIKVMETVNIGRANWL